MKLDTILAHRYQIREQLSQKAGRRTFLALDLHSQNLVIIKILRFDVDFQWDDLKLFEREAQTLQYLNHPAIPSYLDYFEVEEPDTRGFALVQTYINAPSLETIVKSGRRFAEAEVIEIADRVLTILTYLHTQNPPVIHRDIKPSNILLADRTGNSIGDVYLVDFGSVQNLASHDGGTITIVGSYGYIPLEQFGGQTTTASDLYSLGMMLIYLITGNHPAELPQTNGQVKFTAEISTQLHRWLAKMTQPYLDKRFESAKVAQTSLNSADGSHGDFINLKPTGSKVQLYRDRTGLEIVWQDIDQEKNAATVKGCVNYIIIFSIVILFFYNALLGMFALSAFLVIPNLHLFSQINYVLKIDDQSIGKYKYKSSQQEHRVIDSHPRSEISLLAYNPGYVFDQYLDDQGKIQRRGQVTVEPKLYLCCGGAEYIFSHTFSQAELWWLGQELSDFLDLELQIIYPTPQVPAEATGCSGGC